eukprot:TRINITY_DN7849_c0_g1_i1.p1 TRINITY_DN7849_c0_g1~~TRINITY_DN7849_c0_g1_i1.p1  ORF type:complete len:728 (-),score=222.81 TRINITY_DN7849_c0_g1_i1:109-2292(-)
MSHELRRLISGIESRLTGSGGYLVFYGSSVHFGGLDKLLRITKDILRSGSTALDNEGNPSFLPFAKEILPISSEEELDEWLKDKMAHSLFSEALFHIASADTSLSRHYEEDALLRCPRSREKLILAAKCLDEQDLQSLVALDLQEDSKRGHSLLSEEEVFDDGRVSALSYSADKTMESSQSCPGLTEFELSRFLKKRNWVHDEEEEVVVDSRIVSSMDYERAKRKITSSRETLHEINTSSKGTEVVGCHSTPLYGPVRGSEIFKRERITPIPIKSPQKTHRRAFSDTSLFQFTPTSSATDIQEEDHNWSMVTPPSEGWSLPQPLQDESLHSFLSSGVFGRHQARLDRENAHLILAELIIQASSSSGDPAMGGHLNKDSPPPVGRLSPDYPGVPIHSAESIALALLDQLDERHLIRASELYLIMGQEASFFEEGRRRGFLHKSEGSMEIEKCDDPVMELRGTLDWAPPRPQLILQLHANKSRTTLLEEQKYRCAGCAMRVERKYSKTYRYCHYFGKLFCTGCHSNAVSVIPAQILKKWDFKAYFVSDFASTVLSSMYCDPLFNVRDLMCPALLPKISKLRKAIQARSLGLKIYPFVLNCRLETQYVCDISNYPVIDPCVFSLKDLCRVKTEDYTASLLNLLKNLMQHIMKCSLCKARGFLCEGCRSQDIIFPFETDVRQCSRCYACYHNPCFNENCSKCTRIDLRKKSSNRGVQEENGMSATSSSNIS